MNLRFHIDYKTVFGEELVLNVMNSATDSASGDSRRSKGGIMPAQVRMGTHDGEHWTCEVNTSAKIANGCVIDYFYSVETDGAEKRHEWLTEAHRLELTPACSGNVYVYDHWIDIPEDSYLYSSAFTECVNRREERPVAHAAGWGGQPIVRLVVRAPQLRSIERLAVLGGDDALGAWNAKRAVSMVEHNHNEWTIDLNARSFVGNRLEFKFVALDEEEDVSPLWETGLNRFVQLPDGLKDGDLVVYQLNQAFFPIYDRKLAGTLVPVFSLRSRDSFGVGDFGDLKKMVEWVASTRQRVLQILPINDTTITHTWTDSYPYSCISIFALHPQYVDLTALPALKDEKKRAAFEKLREELNSLPQIDYERVNNAKTEYLRLLFEQEGARMMKSAEFKAFFYETGQWLIPYAQYCHLRDTYGTADFSQWPDHQTWNEADRKALSNVRTRAYKEVEFYYFVQFILSTQMHDVHEYARSKGVVLKGDIPIGVNRHGCDVWMEPKYFNLNGQAGAPPDDFSVNGQNWGFPTYNWDAMVADDCIWWVRRFQNMSKYFDAYRIDHVLGFFRIWEIPIESVHGLLGQFSPSLALTREEIEAYGLHWQEDLFTLPYIADWTLDELFKERAQEVKDNYLIARGDGFYDLKPEFDTQRKIEQRVEAGDFREGLYALVSNVLFVRDHKDAEKFHPRISAQLDFLYRALYDNDKDAFNRIYNDYYYRRNNQFWYREAMKKLPRLVQATRMLVCAEDLGMVPDCVQWVMQELRILSLELQSMPKDPKTRFGHLSRNPYRSVCTISSHDMPTLRMWWDEDMERTQTYYNTMLYRGGAAPHPLPGWLARDIISRHLTSPSMLCILALQDWLAIDEEMRLADQNAERVNIPANPRHYWRYRMHLNIEDLMQATEFNNNLRELLSHSGR